MAAATSNPLVRSLGLSEVLQRDAAASVTDTARELSRDLLEAAPAGHVRLSWSRNKLSKWIIDRKLLADLRARRGVYSPDEVAMMQAASGGGMNIIYAPLTETKCRAASAWMVELVLRGGEQPWGVDP